MAHFNRIRSLGFWVLNSVVQPSEMEAFDANLAKAVNGDEGGTWAPSAKIIVGGQGVEITGACLIGSLLQAQAGATITGGDLTVSQDATIQGTLDVDDLATVDSLAVVNDASIQGNAEVQGTSHLVGNVTADNDIACERLAIHGSHLGSNILSVNGAGRITGNCEINGQFACDGAASFGNNVSVGGTLTVTGNTTFNGVTKAKGRFKRRVRTMGDANETVSVSDYDLVFMPAGVMTTSRTVQISTTGAEEGDVIRVICEDTGTDLNVDYAATSLPLKIATTSRRWVELTYISSAWHLSGFGDRE